MTRIAKRALDVAASACALTVLSPVVAAVALAVRSRMGSPVMFRQTRPGLDGEPFEMIKFRTMKDTVDAEGRPLPDEDRQTPLGAFLRSASLDELPELWNVLTGDMSLVGPRPEQPTFIEEFRREVPGYMLRHKVRAGMTGWAQVHGWRGNTSIQERVEHDLYYVQRWSFLLDLRILLMTFVRSARDDDSAY